MDTKSFMLIFIACVSIAAPLGRAVEHITQNPFMDYVTSSKFPDDLKPESDTIFRLDIDPHGDNKPIILLSYENFSDRSGSIWTAYMPAKDGYSRIDHTDNGSLIQFRLEFYYVGKFPGLADKGALLVLYPGKGGGDLVRYTFRNGKVHVDDLPGVDYSNPAHIKRFKGIFKRLDPDALKNMELPPYQELSAAAIKASIQHAPAPEETSQPAPVESKVPPPKAQPQGSLPAPVQPPTILIPPVAKERSSSKPLILAGIVIAALSVLLALVYRSRSQ